MNNGPDRVQVRERKVPEVLVEAVVTKRDQEN